MTGKARRAVPGTLTASRDYRALLADPGPPGAPCPAPSTFVRHAGDDPARAGYIVEAHPLVNLDTGELGWAALVLTLTGARHPVNPRRPALELATSADWLVAGGPSPSGGLAVAVRESAAWLGKRTGALSTEDLELVDAVHTLTRAGARS